MTDGTEPGSITSPSGVALNDSHLLFFLQLQSFGGFKRSLNILPCCIPPLAPFFSL